MDPAWPCDAVPSWWLSLAGGSRSGDCRTVGRHKRCSRPGPSLLSLPSPSLLLWLISRLGPLCPGAWPRSPLRRLPRIVPALRSVKPAGHRGNGAFLEAPLPSKGLQPLRHRQPARLGLLRAAAPSIRARLNSPGQAGDITRGRLAGSWPWPPRAWGYSWPRCVATLCRGAKEQLGLAGCPAGFPEALGKGSRPFFWLGSA